MCFVLFQSTLLTFNENTTGCQFQPSDYFFDFSFSPFILYPSIYTTIHIQHKAQCTEKSGELLSIFIVMRQHEALITKKKKKNNNNKSGIDNRGGKIR